MNKIDFEFMVSKSLVKQGYEVYGYLKSQGGGSMVLPVAVQTATDGDMQSPFMVLTHESATKLMNELWNAGIRPVDVGSPGELTATKAHLEDMRKIAFDFIGGTK